MPQRISPEQFRASDGVDAWSVDVEGATTCFATGSFAKGVELINAIGRLADAAGHHPDVDLRYSAVTVRLFTHDIASISDLDVTLAQQISRAALDLGVAVGPPTVHGL